MATTLVVNPGSSSRKYALYQDNKSVLEIRFENTDTGFEVCTKNLGTQQICQSIEKSDFTESFLQVREAVDSFLFSNKAGRKLENVVIRVVAPGTYFQQHRIINEEYLAELKKRAETAPLHVPVILREIASIQKHFKDVRLVAASDSAFHHDLPDRAREYSISRADAEKFDIHRFGYHGLSVASIVRRIHSQIGIDPERMVVCHVGSGASVTAVKAGKSVETTMGFAPATGLPMSSRAGDIDNAALLELMKIKHWRPSEAELYINTNGGLVGLAGESDLRNLLDRKSQNDPAAKQALDAFTYNIQKAVAAMTVALGGMDVLVLTATAVVRSSELRCLILKRLTHLGVRLSDGRNDLIIGKDGVISVRNSLVKVVVMKTDEMGEMDYVADQINLN